MAGRYKAAEGSDGLLGLGASISKNVSIHAGEDLHDGDDDEEEEEAEEMVTRTRMIVMTITMTAVTLMTRMKQSMRMMLVSMRKQWLTPVLRVRSKAKSLHSSSLKP